MFLRWCLGLLIGTASLASAAASEPLTGQQVRDFMLGTKMSGVLLETNERWYECIAPSGDTVYNIEGSISTGFVEVEDNGRTCFTYPRVDSTSRACFTVEMRAGKPVFIEVDSGVHFRVDALDDGFNQCPTSAPVS